MADPYYFCCPMHSDRSSVTLKKSRFAKVERQERSFGARTLSARESQKLQSKIAQFKEISAKQNKPSENTKKAELGGENIEKRPCFLSSRWEFLSKIRQKTLLMDETLNEKSFAENFRVGLSLVSSAAGAAKYVLPPAFTVDFINYYHARETLLDELSSKVTKFPDTVVESKNEESQLNADLQKIQRQLEQLSKENRNKRDLLHNWYNILKQLDCKNMPQIFVPPGNSNVQKSPASKSPKKFASSMPKLDHFSATINSRP
uniref:Uncharacterized protein n=1 Tax=Romanomermis culicivorax TaxID=13658 RepID=A0A915IBP3_ROMCU